jgi:hypothetical protein
MASRRHSPRDGASTPTGEFCVWFPSAPRSVDLALLLAEYVSHCAHCNEADMSVLEVWFCCGDHVRWMRRRWLAGLTTLHHNRLGRGIRHGSLCRAYRSALRYTYIILILILMQRRYTDLLCSPEVPCSPLSRWMLYNTRSRCLLESPWRIQHQCDL